MSLETIAYVRQRTRELMERSAPYPQTVLIARGDGELVVRRSLDFNGRECVTTKLVQARIGADPQISFSIKRKIPDYIGG